jgi:hypothetical protein
MAGVPWTYPSICPSFCYPNVRDLDNNIGEQHKKARERSVERSMLRYWVFRTCGELSTEYGIMAS